jgi:hypothetical protein
MTGTIIEKQDNMLRVCIDGKVDVGIDTLFCGSESRLMNVETCNGHPNMAIELPAEFDSYIQSVLDVKKNKYIKQEEQPTGKIKIAFRTKFFI